MNPRSSNDLRVRSYFRELRRELGVTQYEIPELTRGQVDRQFVAHLESGGLLGSVKKFLALANLYQADLTLVTQLSGLDRLPLRHHQALGYREVKRRMVAAARDGDYGRAFGWAESLLEESGSSGSSPRDPGRALIGAAAIAGLQGAHLAARRFLELALAAPGTGERNRARALLLLADIEHELGLPDVAEALLHSITAEKRRRDPYLDAKYHEFLGYIRWDSGDLRGAGRAASRAVKLSGTDREIRCRGMTLQARVFAAEGAIGRALELSEQALAVAENSGDRAWIAYAWIRRGNVLTVAGEASTALGAFDQAATLAEEIGHEGRAALAGLYRCEALLSAGRSSSARRKFRRLRRICRRTSLSREGRKLFQRLEPLLARR